MFGRLKIRVVSRALRRGVTGLLAILWLNMSVLPCAMAFQGEADCPHCPPQPQHEDQHGMGAHQGHDMAGHGQADASASCATTQADCCDVITASVDARTGKHDYKPASDGAFATPALPNHGSGQLAAIWRAATDPPNITGSSPPLHVLFCVYLK